MVEAVALGVLVDPFLDCVVHVAVDLEVLVACGGVVEDVEDVVDYFVDGDAGVFPGVEDAAGGWVSGCGSWRGGGYSRSGILQDRSSDSSAYGVEVVGEMVLGQHGVSWVTGVGVVPWDELLVSTRLHHGARSILKSR